MATWVKCTDENGQIIYANLDNAITLFRDDVRHRGTVIAFMGSANGAIVVSDTPEASSNAFNVSSTLPRATRSRWLLIRSSSIVITLPSETRCLVVHGGSFLLSWLRLANLQFSRIRGPPSPTYLCERFRTSSIQWLRQILIIANFAAQLKSA